MHYAPRVVRALFRLPGIYRTSAVLHSVARAGKDARMAADSQAHALLTRGVRSLGGHRVLQRGEARYLSMQLARMSRALRWVGSGQVPIGQT